ncbi:MAG: HAD family hydrolase [Clostridia bacterium]|nr:HAD family hydrolase [Clostridia bacterium]
MKKAILFDLDGTLWDSGETVLPAWNRVLAEVGVRPPVIMDELNSFMGLGPQDLADKFLPMLSDPAERLALFTRCFDAEVEAIRKEGARLYEGVIEMLHALKVQGCFLAVVSNCKDGYIQAFLDYYCLHEIFTDFESAGATGLTKGENIALVLSRNGFAAEDALYVGDTVWDMEASMKAGVDFLHAAYGFGSVPEGMPAVSSPREIPAKVWSI